MAQLGTVQTLVVCVPGSDGVQAACPAGQVQSVTQGYVIASSESVRFDLMAEPFDGATASAFFSFAMVSTITVGVLAYKAGELVAFIRRS